MVATRSPIAALKEEAPEDDNIAFEFGFAESPKIRKEGIKALAAVLEQESSRDSAERASLAEMMRRSITPKAETNLRDNMMIMDHNSNEDVRESKARSGVTSR